MSSERKKRNVLMYLAVEGVVPVLGGCAGALAAGPTGGVAGIVVGQAVEKAINLFGRGIVEKWQAWFAGASPEERAAAVAELVALPAAEARSEAADALVELAPDALPEDLAVALDYLTVLPRSVDRALVPDLAGRNSLPATLSFDDPQALLPLLPQDVPPYAASAELPGTPYRLEELLGSGGFGAVYRAVSPTLQHLPLAIKFCLDRSLLPALNLERSNLERLMRAGGDHRAAHVVRLYGYDLDHPTPYLVYEYVAGGDLTHYLAARRAALGRALDTAEVLDIVTQVARGLGFAHAAGLVHRDVKPTNVLADGDVLKLADFGLGGVAVRRAVQRSRIGTTTIDYLSLAEQASLFRGAGTPLYMSPEQRRGANPDPRHDLYSLGVLWFQLLAGDVSRELHPGWAKELTVRYGVPASHIALIDKCVGWFDERPKDAGELLPLLGGAAADAPQPVLHHEPPPLPARPETVGGQATPASAPRSAIRKERLLDLLRTLAEAWRVPAWPRRQTAGIAAGACFVLVALVTVGVMASDTATRSGAYTSRVGYSFWEILAAAPAVALPTAVAFLGLFFVGGRVALVYRREWLSGQVLRALIREFPAEVEAWGGLAQLSSPAVVGAVIEQVSRDGFTVSDSRPAAAGPRPAPIPVGSVRKEALLARLREVRAALRPPPRRNAWEQLPVLLLIGIVTGLVTLGLATAATRGLTADSRDWVAGISTVTFGVLVPWALSYWLAANARGRHAARVGRLGERVRAAFPGDVAAWGGVDRFADAAFVEAALKRVEAADYEVSPPGPAPAARPGSRARPPALWLAIPLSLVFGISLGVAAGLAVYWGMVPFDVPVSEPRAATSHHYYAAWGRPVGLDQFRTKETFAGGLTIAAGSGAGLAGLAVGLWGLTRRIRFRRATLLALVAGYFLLGVPAVAAGRFLAEGFVGPHRVARSDQPTQFTAADGTPITEGEFARQEWVAVAGGHAFGLVFGLALPAGLVAFVRWRCRVAAEADGRPL